LLALSRRNERIGADPTRIALPMTRADIADFLSLTIETVSRTFTKLRLAGIIDLAQSSLVVIRDKNALERLAAGDV
jgi:CRP-like cAMP-binding protein